MTGSTVQIGEEWARLPSAGGSMTTEQLILCVDRAKYNLFWLVEPRVDVEGIGAARNNPIANSINSHMTKPIREQLRNLPLPFMRWWDKQNHTIFPITASWYPNYTGIMKERAVIAQRYAVGRKQELNVVVVNFRRKYDGR